MSQIATAYDQLLERFLDWARAQPDIRAVIVLGSRARADRPADEWSDLDLWIVAADPDRLLSRSDWLDQIGTPWATFLEPTATGGGVERRVLFAGGLDVDFVPAPLELARRFAAEGWPPEVAGVLRRGARFVLDKDGLAAGLDLASADAPIGQPPEQGAFLNQVNDFWYHAVWTAKKLRRGELWTGKLCCDGYMKRLLLAMIEWHAGAASGWRGDTWHNGRFLEQWADPRALAGLGAAFAHYDMADTWRALLATMDMYRWLAAETAAALGYPYPADADERVTALVKTYFSERP